MFSKWQLAAKYLNYYLTASNGKGHGMHSPFIFHFITKVLNDKEHYPAYDKVEGLRNELLKDETLLAVEDLGAGSSLSKTNKRSIASIAKNAAKPKKFGQLLYRMVKAYEPAHILELGTSLGITTSYLAWANPGASVITMEGATEVATVAKRNFQQLGLTSIAMEEGNFDTVLAGVISRLPEVGLAFIDGNHRREPTERYFRDLLPKINNDSIMIFDDIHWSGEMEQAWETIKAHPSVRCTVDLFFIGIVFFRAEFREKRDFSIRF
ncbi:MAG TPA: class I SAM-dependent methyltransferase [Chitinophagaceae bacterium]|jgi:predicted O-methyltransferase YrrM|nr:class I SAM-dependent methyltransferase [Chitinophagaceae bacterium]